MITFKGLKKLKQINNLSIYQDNSVTMCEFKIASPTGIVLEEFAFLKDAEEFCRNTKDFIKRK